MKWLKEIWDLFVDDGPLALIAILTLGVAVIVAHLGRPNWAGVVIFLGVAGGLWWRTRN